MCEQARDLDSRKLDLRESREHLAEGLVQPTLIVGSGCIEEGRGRQIFEERSNQDLARDQRWGVKERYRRDRPPPPVWPAGQGAGFGDVGLRFEGASGSVGWGLQQVMRGQRWTSEGFLVFFFLFEQ